MVCNRHSKPRMHYFGIHPLGLDHHKGHQWPFGLSDLDVVKVDPVALALLHGQGTHDIKLGRLTTVISNCLSCAIGAW
jgi:hypothetical protein